MQSILLSAGSIGIIGGADGPTTIFVTYPDHWPLYILGAATAIALLIFLLRRKRKQ